MSFMAQNWHQQETHHPIERTVDIVNVALAGVIVRSPEDRDTGSAAHSCHVKSVAGERGDENFAVNHQLSRVVGVASDHLADSRGVRVGVVPVEVERDEHLHAVVGGRLVRKIQLCDRVRIRANVQGKSVDTDRFGPLHVRVEVRGAAAVGYDTDLSRESWLVPAG